MAGLNKASFRAVLATCLCPLTSSGLSLFQLRKDHYRILEQEIATIVDSGRLGDDDDDDIGAQLQPDAEEGKGWNKCGRRSLSSVTLPTVRFCCLPCRGKGPLSEEQAKKLTQEWFADIYAAMHRGLSDFKNDLFVKVALRA